MSGALVVTTIHPPGEAMRALAAGAVRAGVRMIVVGDAATPADFRLEGCRYWPLEEQRASGFALAERLPSGSYARKNLGYLLALSEGAEWVLETDDDNLPLPGFWDAPVLSKSGRRLAHPGWVNAYACFSRARIWPRGFPLESIADSSPAAAWEALPADSAPCPVQHALTDENPDVDAIYRLTLPLPQSFDAGKALLLDPGAWFPFNSQNTLWWPAAFPLLYLPAGCSMRVTDVWRSLVAQACLWAAGHRLLVRSPTLRHRRNAHDLARDFLEELPGYLNNARISRALAETRLAPGAGGMAGNLRAAWATLVELDLLDRSETDLVERWLADLAGLGVPA